MRLTIKQRLAIRHFMSDYGLILIMSLPVVATAWLITRDRDTVPGVCTRSHHVQETCQSCYMIPTGENNYQWICSDYDCSFDQCDARVYKVQRTIGRTP